MRGVDERVSPGAGQPAVPSLSRKISGLSVSFQGVSRRYGSQRAVDQVDLDVAPGEFLSLVGPSGSGKTTLLMMLAGFEAPDAGRILIGGKDVSALPPNKRNLGVVFQKYALFPHRTVAENIGFPLKMRGVGSAERQERVSRALTLVKLEAYGSRLPAQLSGGQQQRVALARAIVFEPSVILMDEPLGALDRKLRQHMQIEIKQLQRQIGATVIYVTHDQDEALSMSDRLAVFDRGRIVQIGPPNDVYDRPSSEFAANFLGELNLFPGTRRAQEGGDVLIDLFASSLRMAVSAVPFADTASLKIGVRPERIKIQKTEQCASFGDVTPPLTGSISQKIFSGSRNIVLVTLANGDAVRAELPIDTAAALEVGDDVAVGFDANHARAFRVDA